MSKNRNRAILFKKITDHSLEKNPDLAIKEWDFMNVDVLEDSEGKAILTTCECSHYPIKERCVIKNRLNGCTLTIGNCCINLFMPEKIKLINAINDRRLNKALIDIAFRDGLITQHAYTFLKERHRTKQKNLSTKAKDWLNVLKSRILNHYLKKTTRN